MKINNLNIRSIFTFYFSVLFFAVISFSQPTNNHIGGTSMSAPNAAAIANYNNVSVNYSSGVPAVSVPLYTIEHGGLSVPVILNYNASGLKPASTSSWIGSQWTLSCQYQVTRSVLGLPDDLPEGYYVAGSNLTMNTGDLNLVANNIKDSESDIYSFNTGNFSGKFVIEHDANGTRFKTIPHQDIKIEALPGTYINEFTIIEPNGTRYIFGGTNAIETTTHTDGTNPTYHSTWNIKRIESADEKQVIHYDYSSISYTYDYLSSCRIGRGVSSDGFGGFCSNTETNCSGGGTMTTDDIKTSDLLEIKTYTKDNSGMPGDVITTVKFIKDSGPRDDMPSLKALDKIEIYQGDITSTSFCQSYDLEQTYWSSGGCGNDPKYCKRLMLEKVTHQECGNSIESEWIFEYEQDSFNPNYAPRRTTKAVDHWGYYNGESTNNSNTVNAPSTAVQNGVGNIASLVHGSSNRETNPSKAKIGTLNKITYPTGGYTRYEYESNSFSKWGKIDSTVTPLISGLSNSVNCGNTICCTQSSPFEQVTLNHPANEYFFDLFGFTQNSPLCGDPPEALVEIWEVLSSGDVYLGSYSFSWNPAQNQSAWVQGLPLTDIYSAVQQGKTYKFRTSPILAIATFYLKHVNCTEGWLEKPVGGLRIKNIYNNDDPNQNLGNENLVSEFEYTVENSGTPPRSSGNLVIEPKYGFSFENQDINGNPVYYTMVSDQSVVALSNFEGEHITYSRVVEKKPNNGKTVYEFSNEPIVWSNWDYPYGIIEPRVKSGKTTKASVFNETNSLLSENSTQLDNNIYNNVSGLRYKLFNVPYFIGVTGSCNNNPLLNNGYEINNYYIPTTYSRPKSVITLLDNVETTTTYTYDSQDRHTFPVTTKFTDSNNDEILTEYEYVWNHIYANVGQDMIARNMIANPWRTSVKVNGTQVDGSATYYRLFNLSTGKLAAGDFPRPWLHLRYEKTWDDTGVLTGTGWRTKAWSLEYSPMGHPFKFRKNGWAEEQYFWTDGGQITKRKFKEYEWDYSYYLNTRLLETMTTIDEQESYFEYDGLMRLLKSKSKKDNSGNYNVITEYDYEYKDPANSNRSWINTKTTFTQADSSDLVTLESRQYSDGLGRTVQNVKMGYSPTQSNVYEAIEYDEFGRATKQYIPFGMGNNGNFLPQVIPGLKFTLNEYEDSPLSRLTSSTPPSWYATTTTYGANSLAEVINYTNGGYYPIGSLNKITVTDPNGNENISFTDKKGRTILTTRQKGTLKTKTFTLYDDKDRVVKIIPPGGNANTTDLNYEYRYDQADNMTHRKFPGKGEEQFLYNTRDLPTYYKDANMAANHWKFSWYDPFGRNIQTKITSISGTPNPNGYSANTVHWINIDSYSNSGTSTGKRTKTRVLNLASNGFLDTNFNYDEFGRVSNTYGNNHLYNSSTAEQEWFDYDYADNLTRRKRIHKKAVSQHGVNDLVIEQKYAFDHSGRQKNAHHNVGYQNLTLGNQKHISNHKYNNRDFLIQKNLHLTSTGDYLQNVDYTYNNQGWLRKINDLTCLGGGSGSGKQSEIIGATGLVAEIELESKDFVEDINNLEFKIKLEIQVTDSEGDIKPQLVEKVFQIGNVRAVEPNLTVSDFDKTSGLSFPQKLRIDKSTIRITKENIGTFLLELEEEVISSLKERGTTNQEYYVSTQLQGLIEELVPFSAREFLELAQGKSTTSPDLFKMVLTYDIANPTLLAPAQKNGNISTATWQVGCNDAHAYGFQYDYFDRLKWAQFSAIKKNTGAYYAANLYNSYRQLYDARGNLTRLYRRGYRNAIGFGDIDYLFYHYKPQSNQLDYTRELNHYIWRDNGLKTQSNSIFGGWVRGYYTHDDNGNVISDEHKGISNIEYNYLNLPKKITFNSGDWIEWNYNAHGKKLSKKTNTSLTRDYLGEIEYVDCVLDAIYHDEGRITCSGTSSKGAAVANNCNFRYEYSLKDHLGNNRVTFTDLDGSNTVDESEILQQSHHYPFGMKMDGITTSTPNKYLYNGKELNEDFGLDWSDYGARWYDASLGRWGQVDPLAETMSGWSPYNYTFNNPIRFIDPDGRMPSDPDDPPGFLQDVIDNGFVTAVNNYFDFGSLFTGSTEEKSQTITRVHKAAEDAEQARQLVLDGIEMGAKGVGNGSDVVEGGALAVTALSGGGTSPVTLPIANTANQVGNIAFGVEMWVDFKRDGTFDQTGSNFLKKLAFGASGEFINKSIEALDFGGKHAEQNMEAVKSVGNGLNELMENVSLDDNK